MNLDIVIAGVGGQGNVLASRILARAAMEAGLAVLTSEVIGMAQREGVVMSQVRMGRKLMGALIPDGCADVLLAFEPAEAVRSLPKLKPGGMMIASTAPVIPVTVALGYSSYDHQAVLAYLKEVVNRAYLLDALSLAVQAGHPRTLNAVLLGSLAALGVLPFTADHLLGVMLDMLPEKLQEMNRRAFVAGLKAVEI